jgi:hypothetical protein
MTRLAVIFAGKLTNIENARTNHCWLWNTDSSLQADVYIHHWDDEVMPDCELVARAVSITTSDRSKMREALRASDQLVNKPDDFIDRHYSQFWCMHEVAKHINFDQYDGVLKTRVDCFPAAEGNTWHFRNSVSALKESCQKPHILVDDLTLAAVWHINETAPSMVDHYMMQSPKKVQGYSDPSWMKRVIELGGDSPSGDEIWFKLCTTNGATLIPNSYLGGMILREGVAPWAS